MVLQFTINTQFILLIVVSKLTRVEAPILAHDPINNLKSTRMLIRWSLNFYQVGTKDAMTHVLVLGEEK